MIGDLVVEPDKNEITAALVLLKELPLEGRSSPVTRSSRNARYASTFVTAGKAHGRLEIRQIVTSAEAVSHLGWRGLAQIAKATRTRRIGGKTSAETVYLITSLSPSGRPERRPTVPSPSLIPAKA